jgi:hypothetical protein
MLPLARIAVVGALTGAAFASGTAALGGHRFVVVNDNIMGGRSTSQVEAVGDALRFTGRINTNGGGFASCRSEARVPAGAKHVKLRVRGDGKLYKFTLRDGLGGPTFQHDFLTAAASGDYEEFILPFSAFLPSFMGRKPAYSVPFDSAQMAQAGFMLSLKTSRGEPNPAFGEGEFPFALVVEEMEFN